MSWWLNYWCWHREQQHFGKVSRHFLLMLHLVLIIFHLKSLRSLDLWKMEKHTMNIGNLMQYYRKKETDNINIKLWWKTRRSNKMYLSDFVVWLLHLLSWQKWVLDRWANTIISQQNICAPTACEAEPHCHNAYGEGTVPL